jgi:osmotically-inducible protein OsmY
MAIMTDRELQDQVQKALDWEPSIDAAHIGVTSDSGVVTLRGDVKTHSEKAAAERVALRVYGVQAVANDMNVRPENRQQRTDAEIAQAVISALKWNAMVPHDDITVTVTNGWVTLGGNVGWEYQRTAAANAVRDLVGVCGVVNATTVEPQARATDVKSKIEAALRRSAEVDARRINVDVMGGTVILSGNVHSWFARDEARHAAWAAPGVKEVDDRISITP